MLFERFTDGSRRAIVLAQDEARRLNHNYIGTEHLLLGLLAERDGVAAVALVSLGVSAEQSRFQVEEIIGEGMESPQGHIPFTPRAKKVLELALRESLQLGHDYIGTEHILLGLVREGEGVAAQVLLQLGADLPSVRRAVIRHLSGTAPAEIADVDAPSAVGMLEEAELRSLEGDPRWPVCARCRSPLEETARYRIIDVPGIDDAEPRAVSFAFCSRCGTWLGTIG